MNEQKNNGRGIFYGVIGVATLVVAIIGATFAYFTATASNNIITGNMASVKLALAVTKETTVDEEKNGMIPMSNGMVEAAVNNTRNEVCVDDNGNAVCQVYKITLTNDSSAGQFVDGYVALKGGSGEPTDYEYADEVTKSVSDEYATTMRWAQVFVKTKTVTNDNGTPDNTEDDTTETVTYYTTAGDQTLGADQNEKVTFTAIGSTGNGKNEANIRDENTLMEVVGEDDTTTNPKGVLKPLNISGNDYNVIGTNYIRVSAHTWNTDGKPESYDRNNDVTSALVYNHNILAQGEGVYYIVVWLSETGTNQTAGETVDEVQNPDAEEFFSGNVTFVSAQGSEVSATFSGYTRVPSAG